MTKWYAACGQNSGHKRQINIMVGKNDKSKSTLDTATVSSGHKQQSNMMQQWVQTTKQHDGQSQQEWTQTTKRHVVTTVVVTSKQQIK